MFNLTEATKKKKKKKNGNKKSGNACVPPALLGYTSSIKLMGLILAFIRDEKYMYMYHFSS